MQSRNQWSPGPGAKVLRVTRTATGGWMVFAAIADRGICRLAESAPDIAMAGVTGAFRIFQRKEKRWRCDFV